MVFTWKSAMVTFTDCFSYRISVKEDKLLSKNTFHSVYYGAKVTFYVKFILTFTLEGKQFLVYFSVLK